jgi:hypothetical protein
MKPGLVALLFTTLSLSAAAQLDRKPNDATEWLQRAAEQMNLRMFGSTPFHMRVVFHAFPGIVLSKDESEQIISGDGAYEESWITPTKWRREVTFGTYHAVEVESEAGRKMQASSDYEPSRVLMLLEALLYPIPRRFSSPLRMGQHLHWKIKNGEAGGQHYVMIGDDPGYLFLPTGELLQSIWGGVVTDFTNPRVFGGKLVPPRIHIQGGSKQDLLTADVAVEPAGQDDATAFTLPGGVADPGMTLRPLDVEDYNFSPSGQNFFPYETKGPSQPLGNLREIVDRHGVVHELEILYSPNTKNFAPILPLIREVTYRRPPTIDKSPCEIGWNYIFGLQ